jgi:hypothetical protein
MYDVRRRKVVSARKFRVAGRAAAVSTTFDEQLWTRRSMYRTVYTPAAQQSIVGGIDDDVDG